MTAKQIENKGTLELRCASGPPAPTKHALAMEGVYTDADEGRVAIMLHVDKNGFMHMLEILRYDGAPIIKPPSADRVKVY